MCNALSHILFCLFLTIGLMDRAFAMEVAFVEVSALSSEREREEGFRLMRGFLLTEYAVDPSGELLSADEELMQFFRDPEDYQKKRIAYEVVRVFYEGVLQAIDSVDQGEIPVYKQDIVMRVKQGCKLVVKATSYDELCALRLSISEDEQELPSIREIIDRLDSFVLKPEAARVTGLSEKEIKQLIAGSVSLLTELHSMASCDDSLSSKIQDAQKTARSHLIAVASTMREAVLQGNARVSDLAWLAPQLIFISQFVTADKNFTNHQRTILTESIAALLNCMKDPAGFYATLENGEPDEADLAASHFMHCLSTSGGAGVCQSDYQEALGDEHLVAVVEFLDGIDEDLALPVSTLTHIWARNKLVRFAAIVRFMLRECDVHTTINKSYPRVFIGLPLADAKRVMQEFPKLLPAVQKLAGLLGF